MVNVKEFGAKGDGSNATEAFRQAAHAVPGGGGVLYIPFGTYVLSEQIVVQDRPVKVYGDGIGISKLVWAADAKSSGLIVIQSRPQGVNTDFTHVTQLSLYTRQVNQATALTVNLSGQVRPVGNPPRPLVVNRTNARISLENLEVRGEDSDKQAWQKAVLLDHGHHAVLNQIHITGLPPGGGRVASVAGIHLDAGNGSPVEIQISQCYAYYVDKALYITGTMEGVKVSQCDFVTVLHGVYAEHCLQMNVHNSHINASKYCIWAQNVDQSSFSNCLFYKVITENGDSEDSVGIQISGASGRNIISSNIFANPTPHAKLKAVVLKDKAKNCLVASCVFMNNGSGIECDPGVMNCQATYNSFESPGPGLRFSGGNSTNSCVPTA